MKKLYLKKKKPFMSVSSILDAPFLFFENYFRFDLILEYFYNWKTLVNPEYT